MTNLTLFDYMQLPADTRTLVQQRAEEIKESVRRSAQEILITGEKLVEVRGILHQKKGSFDAWLSTEFGWSRSQAYNYINAFERFGSRPNFGQLDIAVSAINMLAAPSTPQDVVDEVLERAERGEKITYTKSKEAIQKNREEVVNPLPGMAELGVTPKRAADFDAKPLTVDDIDPDPEPPEPPAAPAAPLPPPLPAKPPEPPAAPATPAAPLPPPLPSKPPEPPATPAAPAATLPPPLPTAQPAATEEEKHAAMIYAQLRILEIATSQAYQLWHSLPKQYKVALNGDLVLQNARNLMTSPALRSAAQFSALNAEVRAE